MLASQYSNNEKGSKNESSEEKTRSRSSSLGRFLMKKKHKKERGQMPHFPQSSSTAGSEAVMIYRRSSEAQGFHTTVLQSSFRRILGSNLETKHGRRLNNYTI
ncbi:uncharacterized protein LOC110049696 [Orbicella faveolata]|uniref:uncharacterized protein LOC110049696 n=1 Tax=Orbicella faveolata TaxID=48498 RepID=UPI0009E5C059|nr:uncharacterized protein LOC110049696 [Orbicella faveolata]